MLSSLFFIGLYVIHVDVSVFSELTILKMVTYVGDTESVMCDVIKILLKRKDERRSGKGNP